MGCSPRSNSPWHLSSTGIAERSVGNVNTIVSKLAMNHPKQWHTYLPMVMWCLREVPNESTGLAIWTLVIGHLPMGPLSILKESWCGDENLHVSFGKMRLNIYMNSTRNWKLQKLMPRLMLQDSNIDTLRITICAVVASILMSENKF